MIEDYVEPRNLQAFLYLLSLVGEVQFDDDDWGAIGWGVHDSNWHTGRWYEYELIGRVRVRLAFALSGAGEAVYLRLEVPSDLEPPVRALLLTCHFYDLRPSPGVPGHRDGQSGPPFTGR